MQNWKRRAKRLAVKGPQGSNLTSILSMEAGKYKTPPSKSKFINKLGGRIPPQTSGVSAGRTVTSSAQQQQPVFQLGAPSVGNVTISPPTSADSK